MAQALSTCSIAQIGPQITFEKLTHDYGDIKKGADGQCVFIFKNSGSAPLIISKVMNSCGCIVPSWPKDPIAPGETAKILVKYDTKRVGRISKSLTVISNAENDPSVVIRIIGNVRQKPSNKIPVNVNGTSN